ncbi:MAG: hypothetical protein L0271_27030, partial [Gemmatimonadetes bacterium]|nr:hypothetical protein [Gemmatimonadota bacterium]
TGIPSSAGIVTPDADALAGAIVTVVGATARELNGEECVVAARLHSAHVNLLMGPVERVDFLEAGRATADAGPLLLERGGLGLALVHAALVLDAHGAERWTVQHSRQTAGIRLRLSEGSAA